MKLITKTKNIELTRELDIIVSKRFNGLKKFINILKRDEESKKTLAEVFIEIERETNHHKKGDIFLVKSQIQLPGKSLMALARGADLMKIVTEARDKMILEIKKYKLKNIEGVRRQQKKSKKQIEL